MPGSAHRHGRHAGSRRDSVDGERSVRPEEDDHTDAALVVRRLDAPAAQGTTPQTLLFTDSDCWHSTDLALGLGNIEPGESYLGHPETEVVGDVLAHQVAVGEHVVNGHARRGERRHRDKQDGCYPACRHVRHRRMRSPSKRGPTPMPSSSRGLGSRVVHRVDPCQQADTHRDQQRYTVMPGPRGTIVPPAVVAARAVSRPAASGRRNAARLPICHVDALACTRQAIGATPSGTLAR
jgi:hypothetical protein